jgi:hypothetical protein
MQTYIDPTGQERPDRRQNPRLRTIYSEVRDKLDHFFHCKKEWAGSSIDYLALRLVHEAYPDLSSDEVRILVAAIERSLGAENPTWGKVGH